MNPSPTESEHDGTLLYLWNLGKEGRRVRSSSHVQLCSELKARQGHIRPHLKNITIVEATIVLITC